MRNHLYKLLQNTNQSSKERRIKINCPSLNQKPRAIAKTLLVFVSDAAANSGFNGIGLHCLLFELTRS